MSQYNFQYLLRVVVATVVPAAVAVVYIILIVVVENFDTVVRTQ
jgi:hypothetical protein